MSFKVKTNQNEILDVSFLTFSGGERHIQLPTVFLSPVNQIDIEARIQTATEIIDLLLLVNALRHQFSRELLINLVIPYLPYARQDRVCADGQAFSLEVFSGLLQSMDFNSITVWDCHSQKGIDLTKANNVTPAKIIAASDSLVALLKADNSVLICPDEGAVTRCREINEYFALSEMVRCYKKRDPSSGRITQTEVEVESLDGKVAVITDDICDGGFTFIKIAEQLKEKGADRVVLYVTHGIFSKGLEVFDGLIDEIYTSSSFERAFKSSKLSIINY
ncbi:ribose-phosphate diphosphokinase [Marinomonas mediterranea]|uniref:ribose-phosphate diphosphokinase n=1 Tax=Marinomonas mediterranea TaxID=119864 RepID=UPI002349F815|nr:ribose-phosphate diphosphokinase [Marinomonas mediterranea]WCN07839.1 ribose-phosphate diphosphokinase [Marinomonas mediterranea]